jgi:hypothetical protein
MAWATAIEISFDTERMRAAVIFWAGNFAVEPGPVPIRLRG